MIEKAKEFAIKWHGDQKYGDQPYFFHLNQVASLLRSYGETAQVIAYLHDVVEDTGVSLDELQREFGQLVASCVSILTDEPGATRQERKAKTYQKMAQVQGELELALIVKAADRLANMKSCIETNHQRLLDTYRREYADFHAGAYRPQMCDDIWQEIQALARQDACLAG
jgi:(p)ppGpp synthase/HD superfamily hydrolase